MNDGWLEENATKLNEAKHLVAEGRQLRDRSAELQAALRRMYGRIRDFQARLTIDRRKGERRRSRSRRFAK